MLIVRIIGFLLLASIGGALLTYLLTRNRRYLIFAWQILKYGFVMACIFLAFMLFERLLMAA